MQDRFPHHSSKRDAASDVLGRDVRDVIAEKRSQGVAYDRIARDLFVETNGRVDVTGQALRNWSKSDDSDDTEHRAQRAGQRPTTEVVDELEDAVDAEIRGVRDWVEQQREMLAGSR
jgi:hypothetical protein